MAESMIIKQDQWKQVVASLDYSVLEHLGKDELNIIVEDTLQGMLISIDSMFWSYKDVRSFRHPLTWKDAFKIKYFPAFLIRLFPIRYKTITIKEVLPKLPKNFESRFTTNESIIIKTDAYDLSETIECS